MDSKAFYGAFLAPVLMLMAVNVVIFLMVMKEIYNIPHMCEKANRLSHFRATVSVFVLLGLNWLFAGLAATVGTLVLHYLFTITCSFQGLFIFLLHGIIKKDFQEAWRMFTTKNRVMEMFRSSSLGTTGKTMSFFSEFRVCGSSTGKSYLAERWGRRGFWDWDPSELPSIVNLETMKPRLRIFTEQCTDYRLYSPFWFNNLLLMTYLECMQYHAFSWCTNLKKKTHLIKFLKGVRISLHVWRRLR